MLQPVQSNYDENQSLTNNNNNNTMKPTPPTPPSQLPPIPEGFEYWGKGPLHVLLGKFSDDVARSYLGSVWETGYWGNEPDYHYALRIGSEIHQKNVETRAKPPLIIGSLASTTTTAPTHVPYTEHAALLKRFDELTAERDAVTATLNERTAERDRWAEAASEHLTRAESLAREKRALSDAMRTHHDLLTGYLNREDDAQ